jgi:hypothetical protein
MSNQEAKHVYDDTGNRRAVIVRDESGAFHYWGEERVDDPLMGMHWSRVALWHPNTGLNIAHETEEEAEKHARAHVDWLR